MKIFISHKVDRDKDLAITLGDKIRLLSGKSAEVEIAICEEIAGGADWQQWIDKEASSADLFVLLHTDISEDIGWCLYEMGVFRGARPEPEKQVCIRHRNLEKSPGPLKRYQHYLSDEEGIKDFFVDLLYKGKFSEDEQISPDLYSKDEKELEDAVSRIYELFESTQLSTDYFGKRIEVGPIGNDEDADFFETSISLNEMTREFLGLPHIALKWQDVYDAYQERGFKWVDDLVKAVEDIRERNAPSQILSPFESPNGRICYPIIGRVDRVHVRPVTVAVIFVEGERAQSNNNALDEGLARAPEPLLTVISLLNMGRRTRWNVITPYLAQLGSKTITEEEVAEVLTDMDSTLGRIINEAQEKGFLEQDKVVAAFAAKQGKMIKQMFSEWSDVHLKLHNSVKNTDQEGAKDALLELQRLNKMFLLLALDRYRSLIDRLDPELVEDSMENDGQVVKLKGRSNGKVVSKQKK